MNRKELVQNLIDQSGLSRVEARWFVDHFFEAIVHGLITKERVEFRGFGVFKLKTRKQASFKNPKNGQLYPGGSIKTVVFQPSTDIK